MYEAKITENTIAMVCSAPTFPHGVIDDVEVRPKDISSCYRREIALSFVLNILSL